MVVANAAAGGTSAAARVKGERMCKPRGKGKVWQSMRSAVGSVSKAKQKEVEASEEVQRSRRLFSLIIDFHYFHLIHLLLIFYYYY